MPGSPAAQAGLLSGDIVTHINSQVYKSHSRLQSVVNPPQLKLKFFFRSDFVNQQLIFLQAIHGAGDLYKLLEGSGDLILTITRDMRTFTRTVRPELPQT